jgi:hypothetical protein
MSTEAGLHTLSYCPRLLCYGHDEMLLYTRKLILDKEFVVERCSKVMELTEILARGPLDLILMCQSVPDAECEEVIERARAASPAVKTLLLQENSEGSCSWHSDATMEGLEGPPALLHEIHALLGIAAAQNATETLSSKDFPMRQVRR